jgi:hypothetical protein
MRKKRTREQGCADGSHNFGRRGGLFFVILRHSHRMIGVVLLCWLLGSVPLAIGAGRLISGRKTAAQMARMFGVSPPTVSRIVAAHVAGT